MNTIERFYANSPFFKDYRESMKRMYSVEWDYLSELNIAMIAELTDMLGIKTPKFIKSSELDYKESMKTDRLINVLKCAGADEYVSGPAAKNYIEPQRFIDSGITLYWFDFKHPVYPQRFGEFISHLSVIDLLFNCGSESITYLRKGCDNSHVLDGAFVK